jgi:DNA mismatch endonuclease (patch repair protein)
MDRLTPEQRSRLMSRIRGKNTKPEMIVRSWLHKHGYRFRLHRKDLPGKPDIVLPKYKTVIFVHGCFWHRHEGCKRATIPKSNAKYWQEKFLRNQERDNIALAELYKREWNCLVLWECQIADGTFAEVLGFFLCNANKLQ